MAKQVQILYPIEDEESYQKISQIMSYLSTEPTVYHLAKFIEEKNVLIIFTAPTRHVGNLLDELEMFDVGTEYGAVASIITLQSMKPRMKKRNVINHRQKEYRLTDRVSTEEIFEIVDGQLHLTFDYLIMIIVASLIAGVGLATESAVLVVAAMVISPLMGPILGLTFGTIIQDKMMVIKSIRNEIIGVFLTFVIGMVMGVSYGFGIEDGKWGGAEIEGRGLAANLIPSIVVAIPSGVGLAISVVQGGAAALVGIAISVALLPPVVNSGMNFTYGMIMLFREHSDSLIDIGKGSEHWLSVSLISFILFLVNLVCIYFSALIFFKIKEIKPIGTLQKMRQSLLEEPDGSYDGYA
eukprot:TRINITY_DN8687_c0_g1_i1.p1 TRINITY_DN8687_c0_g1~~TRINITY_DN8687_c0_g1_i1.p1  ORF type:complete len:360 (-),score=66.97 TRINITY_DN8687_c0_g1_i1:28-1086(-)